MKKVLRSLIWVEPAEKLDAAKNFGFVHKERLLDLRQVESEVFDFLTDFYVQYGEAPTGSVLHDHFENLNKTENVVLVEEVLTEHFYSGASLERTFEDEVELQSSNRLVQDCKKAVQIATQGVKTKGGLIKGTDQAVDFLFSSLTSKPTLGTGIPANMKLASDRLDQLYEARKANPIGSYGVATGYGLIDAATAGIRRKNLYLHAGFASHLKSTHAFNMIVNAAEAGWNGVLFTTEMPADDVQLMMICIHSGNMKFAGIGRPLNTFRLLLGQSTPQEETFFKIVKDDLVNNSSHGSIRVIDSGEFLGLGSIMQRTVREHMIEEVDILWIDYLTRLPVDLKYKGLQLTEARNEMLAEAKRFAMSFDKGKGLAVCSPFQVNRAGYKAGMAEGGKLDKSSLAQYNAAEKEADIISYIWYGEEEQATSEPKVGLMKARWGAVPRDPVPMFIDPDCRRISDLSAGLATQALAPTKAVDGESEVQL